MPYVATLGNLRIREIPLVNGVEKKYSPPGDSRAVTIHSRGNFDIKVAVEVGGTAGGIDPAPSYITIPAGVFWSVPSDIQTDNFYFLTNNVGGDTVEFLFGDSLTGMDTAAGINLGFKP